MELTVKAIVQDAYGEPDVLRLDNVDKPTPGADEVLVRVHAAAVDEGVWHLMAGVPYLIRLGFGLRAPKTRIRGADVAGVVEAAGKEVTEFQPGDEVYGCANGSFAEFASAPAKKLVPKPPSLSFAQAAAVPISGMTALQAVRDVGKVQPGQQVLVIGAGGGVGSYAVQVAKAFGAEVTGVCSTAKTDLVRSLGADHVVDYSREDFTTQPRRYDVILDTAGNRPLSQLSRVLTARGTVVVVGAETDGRWFGGIGRQLRGVLTSPLRKQKTRMFISGERKSDLLALTELIEAGKLTPAVDGPHPLAEVPEVIRRMRAGETRGKAVISVLS